MATEKIPKGVDTHRLMYATVVAELNYGQITKKAHLDKSIERSLNTEHKRVLRADHINNVDFPFVAGISGLGYQDVKQSDLAPPLKTVRDFIGLIYGKLKS